MTEDENNILNFIAIVPNNTDFEKGNFYDVRSPNPEDMAQEIVKQLPKSNVITVASFGPQSITSHSYLVGQVSILDSLLHSFADAKIEVKVVLKNSSKRYPSRSNYYSINSNKQIDQLAKKIRTLPDSDYIKAYLYIQKYTIILLSLPPFLPFTSRVTKKIIANGWNILMNPSQLIHTRALALLHFDPNLPTESSVLKFLPNENRVIQITDEEIENLGQAVQIQFNEEEIKEPTTEEPQQKAANQNDDYIEQENNAYNDNEVYNNDNKSSTSMNSKQNANNQYDRNAPINRNDDENLHEDGQNQLYDIQDNQQIIEEEDADDIGPSNQQIDGNQTNVRNQPSKQTINVKQFMEIDNESQHSNLDEDMNIHEEEDLKETEASIEVQIQKFVSKLQLNIPVLTDSSVFSTLFQQLFYERWKSSILNQYRSQMSALRDQIKERATDEITSLKQLVNSKDMTMLIEREEQRMRALEDKTVETLEQVMEQRLQKFANVPQKSLLKNYQTLCGDNITLQKQIRQKRAETRSLIIQIKIHQFERMLKLQDYHQKVEELEMIASSQNRLENAEMELEHCKQNNKKLMADKAALIKQREKVKAMLEKKQKAGK